MNTSPQTIEIPDDLKSCQTLIQQLAQRVDSDAHVIESHELTILELERKRQELEQEKIELELALSELMQRVFIKRRERYIADPRQLKLDFGDTDDAADATEGLAQAIEEAEIVVNAHTRRKRVRKPRQERFPDHLLRYEVEAPVPDEIRNCPAHGERQIIGYDCTETLEFERPKLRVRVTKYPKFACPNQPQCGPLCQYR